MPIRVTCNKCHTRFNVSEKFAGKEGPCPKCKSKIRIPDKSEEVLIAAPTASGPVDSKGQAVVKPIRRKETVLSSVQLTIIAVSIIGFLAAAYMLGQAYADSTKFPLWLMGLSAVLIAPPIVYVAYAFLRDAELDPFRGQDLWGRVLICSAIYAIAWAAMPLAYLAFDNHYEVGSYVIAGVAMFGIGGVAGMLCFDLDYFMGSVHYGLYLGVCLLGRWIAGVGALPIDPPRTPGVVPAVTGLSAESLIEFASTQLGCLLSLVA